MIGRGGTNRQRRHVPDDVWQSYKDRVKDRWPASAVASEILHLELKGDGTGFCPFHPDGQGKGKASFQARVGWKCFNGCGAGADGISLAAKFWNLTTTGRGFAEVLEKLAHLGGIPVPVPVDATTTPPAGAQRSTASGKGNSTTAPTSTSAPAARRSTSTDPRGTAPTTAPPLPPPASPRVWTPSREPTAGELDKNPAHGSKPPAHQWRVLDADGRLFGIQCRWNLPPGGEGLPASKSFGWWRNGVWKLSGDGDGLGAKDAPLYGSERLASFDPARPLFLVEGEKAADALAAIGAQALGTVTGASICPEDAALAPLASWPGPVILWADADPEKDGKRLGFEHMAAIGDSLLRLGAADVRGPWIPAEVPPRGDAVEWIELHHDRPGTGPIPPVEVLAELETLAVRFLSFPLSTRPLKRTNSEGAELGSFHGSVLRGTETNRRAIRFRTAREICSAAPVAVPWLLRGFLAAGSITELSAKPKAGKTTWLLRLIRALTAGGVFMGEQLERCRVVLLSEQNDTTLGPALKEAGLVDSDDLSIVYWWETVGYSWPEVCDIAAAECERIGAPLLIVDTWSQFAGLKDENAASEVLEKVKPVQAIAARDRAVVLARHDRKMGGEVGDSGRGSNALTGAVDIVLNLTRLESPQSKNEMRKLKALSRFGETPQETVIELSGLDYIVHGDVYTYAVEAAALALVAILPTNEAEARSIADLVAELQPERISMAAINRALKSVEGLHKVGEGKKNAPFRYWLTAPKSSVSMPPVHEEKESAPRWGVA